MASPKLSLETVDDLHRWDELVNRAPQGTLFSETFFLKAAGRKHHLWWVMQGQEVKAGVSLIVSDDERNCELDDLFIYGGVLFDLDRNRQSVKLLHDEFQISEFVASQLPEIYDSIELTLCPQFHDMRPFQWYRYHDDDVYKYSLSLRYTSYLDISCLREYQDREEDSPFFKNMETVRRYSVRQARRNSGSVIPAEDGATLIKYYQGLMESQGDPPPPEKLQGMYNVINTLVSEGRGVVFHVLDADGNVLYAVMYGWDGKRAYYLYAAGHPELDEPWQGTLAHWTAFKHLAQERGVDEIDLEGVNSPQRGWFKLGFGGDLRPYYHILRSVPPRE